VTIDDLRSSKVDEELLSETVILECQGKLGQAEAFELASYVVNNESIKLDEWGREKT
jgi:hypothetical protein